MDAPLQLRLRLKSDGRVVEILSDGTERVIEPAASPLSLERVPAASVRSSPSARLAAVAPRRHAKASGGEPQSRLAARLARLAPPVPARDAGEADETGSAADAAYARKVRAATGLTQAEFSSRIGVPIETVRNWEQGKRSPRGPARALLKVIEKAPDLVFAALAPAP